MTFLIIFHFLLPYEVSLIILRKQKNELRAQFQCGNAQWDVITLNYHIPILRPRFAGKCDPQSSDLTQLPRGYNFAVKPATNHPRSSCWMRTCGRDIFTMLFVNFCASLGFEPDTSASSTIAFTNEKIKTYLKLVIKFRIVQKCLFKYRAHNLDFKIFRSGFLFRMWLISSRNK